MSIQVTPGDEIEITRLVLKNCFNIEDYQLKNLVKGIKKRELVLYSAIVKEAEVDILDMSLDSPKFWQLMDTRICNAFHALKIITVRDLIEFDERELKATQNYGKFCHRKVLEFLEEHDLKFDTKEKSENKNEM